MLGWIVGSFILGAIIALTIDAIIENYVTPFLNKNNVNKALVVKKKDIRKLMRSVSPEKRRQAEAVMAVLDAQSNDTVIFGKDYAGQVWYQTGPDAEDCEDLNNAAYEVSRSGYKEKIYIG